MKIGWESHSKDALENEKQERAEDTGGGDRVRFGLQAADVE